MYQDLPISLYTFPRVPVSITFSKYWGMFFRIKRAFTLYMESYQRMYGQKRCPHFLPPSLLSTLPASYSARTLQLEA